VLPLVLLAAAAFHGQLQLHVAAVPARSTAGACLFVIRAPLREGGHATTCLTSVDGFPSPRSTIRSAGTMTFALPQGTVRTRIRVTQRFAADGAHATQTLTGTVVGGTGRYRGARGVVRGGGSVVDRRGGLGPVRLAYRLVLR
jgi:hypothetical protein